jgi:hypothetical protein
MRHRIWPAGQPGMLALWSAPRCRSTAFARMITERGDFTTLHEPFSHLADFGAARVGDVSAHDEAGLIAAIRSLAAENPVFFKDTTDFHYPGLLADQAFLADAVHTFIIRDPAAAIASHYALNPRLGRDEIGFAWLTEIYDAAAVASRTRPVVIDSDLLVRRPAETVAAYCRAVGMPFDPGALSWVPGMRSEWKRTSRWHESTSGTSGFIPATGRENARALVANDPVLAGYLDYHLPFYEKLRQATITV